VTVSSGPLERGYVRHSRVVDAMLVGTVVLWALNITATKYLISNGWSPLAYGTLRYFFAIVLFAAYTYHRERSFAIARRDIKLVLLAGGLIFCNQLCFVYGLKFTQASTVGLLLGTTPMFIGTISAALGLERLGRSFWIGAIVTVLGVAFVALGSGRVDSSAVGVLLAIALALTWSAYSVVIAPLMRRYSPFRISTVVLATGWLPLAVVGAHQIAAQQFTFGWLAWLAFAFAVIGPLFLTNVLWFTAMSRVGPSRAALFANFEPFLAVVFAVILLSERLYAIEIVGGVLILAGIVLERVWHQPTAGAMSALD
jgi:drug/metabolite transporter (DMT)-like permease